jgi:hypothetical protein
LSNEDVPMTEWYDHVGNIMRAPVSDTPTGYGKYDQLTHRLMRPQYGQVIQATSWCGHRVHEVPGRGDVDCPECLEIQERTGE